MNAPEKFLAGTAAQPATGSSHAHESARAQVAGTATYVDDIPEVRGTLHAAPILSTVARGRLLGVDTSPALQMEGVKGVVLAQDVPGDPILATFVQTSRSSPATPWSSWAG
jgi:xanthine dehydrogenase large subunit